MTLRQVAQLRGVRRAFSGTLDVEEQELIVRGASQSGGHAELIRINPIRIHWDEDAAKVKDGPRRLQRHELRFERRDDHDGHLRVPEHAVRDGPDNGLLEPAAAARAGDDEIGVRGSSGSKNLLSGIAEGHDKIQERQIRKTGRDGSPYEVFEGLSLHR